MDSLWADFILIVFSFEQFYINFANEKIRQNLLWILSKLTSFLIVQFWAVLY